MLQAVIKMFVYSVKTSKKKIVAGILLAAVIVGAVAFAAVRGAETPVAGDAAVNYLAQDASQRTAFISQFGWQVEQDPTEVSEVIIPAEFDEGYSAYNEIQKEQNLDLELYKGLRAKRWTYNVLNYPGYEGKSGYIQLNLLVYDGRVIGGDVCSLEQGGFMHGFDYPQAEQQPTAANQTNSEKQPQ